MTRPSTPLLNNQPGRPQVDVVIPAYNAKQFIVPAVASALAQEGVEVTVTVVDAGSTDGTGAAVAGIDDPRVLLHHSPQRLNAAKARNLGMRMGKAPWVSFLDADDLWPMGRTEALIEAAQASGAALAFGHSVTFTAAADVESLDGHGGTDTLAGPSPGSVVIRRDAAEALGPMDETLDTSEFVDWMARARRRGLAEVSVGIVVLFRRAHAGNTTRNRDAAATGYLRTIARHLRERG